MGDRLAVPAQLAPESCWAIVGDSEAHFAIGMPRRQHWAGDGGAERWPGEVEYAWRAGWEAPPNAKTYRLGVDAIVRRRGERDLESPESLAALVGRASLEVTSGQLSSEGIGQPIEHDAAFTAEAVDNVVVLHLRGADAVQRYLAHRPDTARFSVHQSRGRPFVCKTLFQYVGG